MIARMLVLIAVLALPVAALTGPASTSQAPWTDRAVEAKGKNHIRISSEDR